MATNRKKGNEIREMDFSIKETFLGDILENHMKLLSLADSKANMLLVASGLVLTLSLEHLTSRGPLFYGFLIITFSTMSAATLAMMVILPRGHTPSETNLMYFRSFLDMKEENYIRLLKKIVSKKDLVLEEYGREIYNLGERTLKIKYRYLKAALIIFIGGFLLGTPVVLVSFI